MFSRVLRCAVVAFAVLPAVATADPIKLKFSFFTSDRSYIYQREIKPFVDGVNAAGKGLIEIDMYFSGGISKSLIAQPALVADGTADLALLVPGLSSEQFSDIGVMELPGLYRDATEASRVFSRLVEAKALKGFDDYVLIAAFESAGESIHSRKPISSLADLNGQTVRANNPIEAATLERLGAIPVLTAINQTAERLSQGTIDAATVPPSMLFEFGIGRVTSHHYMIALGGTPTMIVMNRAKFESLPPQAQAIIRKYSGEWLSDRAAAGMDAANDEVFKQIESDPRRTVVFPSAADAAAIAKIYAQFNQQWASSGRHNRELLDRAKAEIAKLRTEN